MYVKIGNSYQNATKYTEIRNLAFDPETDVFCDSLPVNELTVDVKTEDTLDRSAMVFLFDDLDQIWANYFILMADEVDDGFIRVRAQSVVGLLDRGKLPAIMYDTTFESAVMAVFAKLALMGFNYIGLYRIENSLKSKTIKGYCPKQTLRERLQWLCFSAGAYVKQSFPEMVTELSQEVPIMADIQKIDENDIADIPIEQTYWKPSIEWQDYVTKITVMSYSFREGEPQRHDDYVTVKVNGQKVDYIVTETEMTLVNQNVPANAPPNEIVIEQMYLVHSGNVDDILSRLALIYFFRGEVDADIINNREYEPAQKVNIQLGEDRQATGYIEGESFSFGVQAKSNLKLVGCLVVPTVRLTIKYTFNGITVATKRLSFPVGYTYQVTNPYPTYTTETYKYILRPETAKTIGTMPSDPVTVTVRCFVALRVTRSNSKRILKIVSVDGVERTEHSGDYIAEIE